MTNEEAIKIIEVAKTECEWNAPLDYQEAINVAIEALKAQSKHDQNTMSKQPDSETLGIKTEETCEDVISRQDAIDIILADKIDDKSLEIMTALGDGRLALTLNDACDRHIRAIEQLPSVQQERKKGKWIEVDDPDNRISGRCSICDWEALLYETDVVGMDYCPNCGADMRGEADEKNL